MDKVEVKVTCRLVWALWWRMMLISVGVWVVIYLILFAIIGVTTLTYL